MGYYEDVYLDYGSASAWSSSNENVATIRDSDSISATLNLLSPGTTTITAEDENGNRTTCQVIVTAPELVMETKSLTEPITKEESRIEVTSGYGLSYKSSNPSVVEVSSDSSDYACYLVYKKVGKAVITVTDCADKSIDIPVTVTEAKWYLEKTKAEFYLSDGYESITVKNNDGEVDLNTSSSNINVVDPSYDSDSIEMDLKGVGTAQITVKDPYGKTQVCTVTVKPDPLELNRKSLLLNTYSDEYSEENDLYFEGSYNKLTSVKTENKKIATVRIEKGDEKNYAWVTPVSAGKTNIVLTDQYKRTVKVPVTITQKYIDEMKYGADLEAAFPYEMSYGKTSLSISCDIAATVYTTINGKKYFGKVDEEGDYVINNLPVINSGKSYKVIVKKGQAYRIINVPVEKVSGSETTVSVKAQLYTGKTLRPALTIKCGKRILKKGKDYTVKYSNNKNIGRAKATITFKGNYKGAKAAYFNIVPKGTSIKKISRKKNGFTVKWKKQKKMTSGYQIQYDTDKLFRYFPSTITVNGNGKVSKKVKNLYDGPGYYVRIRTFKKVKGKRYYSAWSKAKAVKIKL